MDQQNSAGQVSPDGMWRWDGAQWIPTEKQMHGDVTESPLEMVSGPDSPARAKGDQRLDKRAAKAAAKQEAAMQREAARQGSAAEKQRHEFALSPVGPQPAPPQAAPRLQHTPLLQPAREGKPWWRATWAVSMAAFIVGLVIAAAASGNGGSTAATASGSGPTVTVTAEADSAPTATATRTFKVKIPPPPPRKVIDGDGTWVVGEDIEPGTYRNSDGGACHWARLKGLTGDLSDVLANGGTGGQAVVTIKPTDKGFQTERCGSWSRVG